jgi:hypothetical protein
MSKTERIAELEAELSNARNELFKAQDAGNGDAVYEWKQEVSSLAKELVEARIDRPFTAYEDEYGDYPL